MKIKHFAFAAALLSATGFSSCSNENETIRPGEGAAQARVSFSIAIPKGEPVTYAATHDEDEWGIESLWLYEYDAAGRLLAAPVNIKGSLTGMGPEYVYEKSIRETDKGMRRFVLVANEEPVSSILAGTMMPALNSLPAGKILSGNTACGTLLNEIGGKKRIPMTGTARQPGGNDLIAVTGAPAAVSVEMERIVARLDINNQVPNLVITDVKLAKVNSRSYLFLNGDYTVPASSSKVSGITPFAAVPSPFGFNKKMPKAFYLYEGHQPGTEAKDAMQIEVTGSLGGVPVFYSIPFWKDSKEVAVKRNHIYRLVLGDGHTSVQPGSNVLFSVEDTPWNELTMNETWDILSATHAGTGTYDAPNRLLSVDNAAHNGITFNFTAKFAGHTAFTATVANAPDWITAAFTGNTLAVTVKQNTATGAADREAVITVTSDADAGTKYAIKVKQVK